MKRVLFLAFVLAVLPRAWSAPVINATAGTVITGGTITVSGTGLPVKSRGKYWMYADGQEGSLAPHSTLSHNTTFAQAEHMTTISDSNKRWGNGAFRSNWNYTSSERAGTIRATTLTGITYDSKIMVTWWEKSDIDYMPSDTSPTGKIADLSQNWKSGIRFWWNITDGANHWPNFYWGSVSINQDEDNLRFSTELPSASSTLGASYGFTNPTWRRIMGLLEMNSSLGSTDGVFRIYKNNQLVKAVTNWKFNDATHPNFANQPFFQQAIANANVPSGKNFWLSDLVIDDSWGRYEVCNNQTYASATHCEIQPITSASATNASLTLRLGTLTGTKWLIAIDDDNVASTGVELETSAVPPPSIISLTPGNGPDGTTVIMTATDLVDTPSVTVNGVAATGETFIGSTSMTFVVPAGTADTCADVIVINPDTQSDTLPEGWCYDPAPIVGAILPWAEPF